MTEIKESAKIEVLRDLLHWRDEVLPILSKQISHDASVTALGAHYLDPQDAWQSPWDEVVLAARELAGMGHITLQWRDQVEPELWGVAITDAGAAWIAAHDMLGEINQEASYGPAAPEVPE